MTDCNKANGNLDKTKTKTKTKKEYRHQIYAPKGKETKIQNLTRKKCNRIIRFQHTHRHFAPSFPISQFQRNTLKTMGIFFQK